MTHHDLDHLFTSARNVPIETSATEIGTWVGTSAVTSTGMLGVAGKLKLFIAKKSIMLFGITLGTVGVVAISTSLVGTPSEKEESLPRVTSQFVDGQSHQDIQQSIIDQDDTLDLSAPDASIDVIPPMPSIAPPMPVAPVVLIDGAAPKPPKPCKVITCNTTCHSETADASHNSNSTVVSRTSETNRRGIPAPPIPMPRVNQGNNKKGPTVSGDGNVVKEDRTVQSFSQINIEGLFNVTISQGDKEGVTVETDKNLQEYVIVKNDGNTLIIKNAQGKFKKITKMNIHIVVKDINKIVTYSIGDISTVNPLKLSSLELRVKGVGDANFELECDKLDVDYSGVGDLTLSGNAETTTMVCTGVGDVKAYELEVTNMKLNQSGVGDTKITVKGDLSIQFSGVGDISYKGKPTNKDIKKSGIGSVKAK